jgi:hypothetical protein
MTADRFNWKEMAQLVGGVAAVALIQVGSWVVMTLFVKRTKSQCIAAP